MAIHFDFNPDKALQAIAYLLQKKGPMDKVKLAKLLYLGERDHFLQVGYPITGDRLRALPYGPVPSSTLDLLNGELWPDPQAAFSALHIDNNTVSVVRHPGEHLLDESDRQVLDRIAAEHGDKRTWALVDETHKLPEYVQTYIKGKGRPIPYELLLKIYGGSQGFRHGRPVVSETTMARMKRPFAASEADL
jgi:uncharacterized phage-associated protein